MITASNEAKLSALPEHEGIKIISALTHREIVDLLTRTNHAPELFDDRNIVEITDPGTPEHRSCLCRNPHSALRETRYRYKSLGQVEQAFRNMKKVSLEMRPMHHKRDDRIRAHVFLCMLAYYLQWHLWERLQPLFDEQSQQISAGEKEPKERCWTLANVLASLKSIQRNEVAVAGAKFYTITTPDAEAQRILDLLKISLPKL